MSMPVFSEGQMRRKYGLADVYTSPQGQRPGCWPSIGFYLRLVWGPFRWLCARAARGQCDDNAWIFGSAWVGDILEEIGGTIAIRGMSALKAVNEPCVFIANHMSTLETFLLPAIVRPYMPVTFVVKKSLLEMPLFGAVMRSREPVVVGRRNARQDLATVLREGGKRLANGVSIIVFPQSTRSMGFEREHFNTIGVKLAARFNAPAIPLALKTDAWGQGRKIKEAGRIRPDLPARFQFGRPMRVEGNGKREHAEICRFIEEALAAWRAEDGINA